MARKRSTRRIRRRSSEFLRHPSFERLEDRAMLTIVFNPVFGPEAQIQNLNAVEANPPVYLIFWARNGNPAPGQPNKIN